MIISAAVLTGTSSLSACKKQKMMLHDHRPLTLNTFFICVQEAEDDVT